MINFEKSTSRGFSFPTSDSGKSRQRRRTEKSALSLLDESLELPAARRLKALQRIRSAVQPAREVRKIIGEELGQLAREIPIDHSDVQELRVKLTARDLTLCPEQECRLRRLDFMVAKGVSRSTFDREAMSSLLMPNSLPLQHRKDERANALM